MPVDVVFDTPRHVSHHVTNSRDNKKRIFSDEIKTRMHMHKSNNNSDKKHLSQFINYLEHIAFDCRLRL